MKKLERMFDMLTWVSDGYMNVCTSKFIELYTKICAFYCVYLNKGENTLKHNK